MNKSQFENLCSGVLVPRFIKAISEELNSIDATLEIIAAELGRRSVDEPQSKTRNAHDDP